MSLFAGARHFFRVLWKASRELFHEVTGTLFFILAVSSLQSAWRAWHRGAAQWLVGVSAGFALMMIFFGILSFRDSRRVR
jgi:glycerol uptake facilitator-like aquaporin